MAFIRRIGQHFDAYQIQPRQAITRAEALLQNANSSSSQSGYHKRRELDRRCHRDRRQTQQRVLLDLRSPYSRRTTGRRSSESGQTMIGIDVYA